MYILLFTLEQEPIISLEEPDDCTRLHVAIHGLSESAVQQALEREHFGYLENHENAWLRVDTLRRLAQGCVEPDWSQRFEQMLHYAASKGWLDTEQTHVKGHCEWDETASENPG